MRLFSKYFLILSLLFCASCRFWQGSDNANTTPKPMDVVELESSVPFATKEPEIFQAEIVTKSEDTEDKGFIAISRGRVFRRSGDMATLQNELSKTVLLDFARKIYSENLEKPIITKDNSGETLNDFLTTEWLNQKVEGNFESLGEENGLSKYRTAFENSETLVFVDEKLQMPVRQEFYSIEGEAKNLLYSTELKNIKLIADEQFFEIPKDFRKVTREEFTQ